MPMANLPKNKLNQKRKEMNKCTNAKNDKYLINVNVVGSAGPIRFVVNEKDFVARVIETSLKIYAKESRLPVLGNHASDCLLYSVGDWEVLNLSERIGSYRSRNFMLCKKHVERHTTQNTSEAKVYKGNGSWKAQFTKSFSCKVLSH